MYYHSTMKFPYDPSLEEWEQHGYKSRVDMLTHLVRRRTTPELPTVEDFIEDHEIPVYTLDGPAVQTWRVYFEGTPRYWVNLGHEMDSWWKYPEVMRELFDGPEHTCSHAEMKAAQRVKARRAQALAKGKLRVSTNE